MQCVGYEGKTEVQVCCLCDKVFSMIPANTTLETQLASRCTEGTLTVDAERQGKVQVRDIFEEMAKKAHQVMAQRRKADYFSITFGCWFMRAIPTSRFLEFMTLLYQITTALLVGPTQHNTLVQVSML